MEELFWDRWRYRFPTIALHPQVRIIGAKGHPTVDFLHRATKTVIEIDGVRWHNTPEDRAHDAERDVALRLAGYQVVRLSGREVYGDLGACVERVGKAMGVMTT